MKIGRKRPRLTPVERAPHAKTHHRPEAGGALWTVCRGRTVPGDPLGSGSNVGFSLTHGIGRTDEAARQLTKNLDDTMRRRSHMICNFIRLRQQFRQSVVQARLRLPADAVQPKREKAAANRGFSMLDSPFGKLERVKRFERSTPTLARLCSTPELHPLARLLGRKPSLYG
jgi:hypothetical protein